MFSRHKEKILYFQTKLLIFRAGHNFDAKAYTVLSKWIFCVCGKIVSSGEENLIFLQEMSQ